MLRQVFIYRNQEELYYRQFGKALKLDVMSGIVAELKEQSFGRSSSIRGIQSYDYFKYKISYLISTDYSLIFLFVTGLDESMEDINKELNKCKKEFINLFGDILDQQYDLSTFEVFNPTIDAIHRNLRPKISLIGFSGVGKTTTTRLIRAEEIPTQHIPTITGDIATIKIGKLTFHLWDFAGQEQFSYLWNNFVKGSDAALLITDSTLENIEKSKFFLELIKEEAPNAHTAVIANKQDLPDALSPIQIENILGIKTYSMIAIDENNRNKMIQIIADVLEMSAEISPLLKPLLERDNLTEEAMQALKNGEFSKALTLFETISYLCIELGDDSLGREFYEKAERIKQIVKLSDGVSEKEQPRTLVEQPIPPAPVEQPIPPAPVEQPIPPAPVEQPIPPAPVEQPIPPAPVEQPIPPAPVEQPIPPAPIEQPIPPAPVKQPIPPAPVKQPKPPAPVKQPKPPAPVEQPIPPAPVEQPIPPAPVEQPIPPAPVEQPKPPAPVEQPKPPAPVEQPIPPAPVEQPKPPAPVEQPKPPAPVEQPKPPAPVEQPIPPAGLFETISKIEMPKSKKEKKASNKKKTKKTKKKKKKGVQVIEASKIETIVKKPSFLQEEDIEEPILEQPRVENLTDHKKESIVTSKQESIEEVTWIPEKLRSFKTQSPFKKSLEAGLEKSALEVDKKKSLMDIKLPDNIKGVKIDPNDFMIRDRPKTVVEIPKMAKNKLKTSSFGHVSNPSAASKTKTKTEDPTENKNLISGLAKPKIPSASLIPKKTTQLTSKSEEKIIPISVDLNNLQEASKKELEQTLMNLKIELSKIQKKSLELEMQEFSGGMPVEEIEKERLQLAVTEKNTEDTIKQIENIIENK